MVLRPYASKREGNKRCWNIRLRKRIKTNDSGMSSHQSCVGSYRSIACCLTSPLPIGLGIVEKIHENQWFWNRLLLVAAALSAMLKQNIGISLILKNDCVWLQKGLNNMSPSAWRLNTIGISMIWHAVVGVQLLVGSSAGIIVFSGPERLLWVHFGAVRSSIGTCCCQKLTYRSGSYSRP